MGEQSFQQAAGVLREAEADRTANGVQSECPEHKQGFHVDRWRRANPKKGLFIQVLDEMTGLLAHAVLGYSNGVKKEIQNLKKTLK